MGETMIQRRNAIKIIGAALLAPKVCFAQKQLLPETQMIIDTVNSWNLKRGEMVRFWSGSKLYKEQKLANVSLFHEHHTGLYPDFYEDLTWPISGVDPILVLIELQDYFGGKITVQNNKYYGLKVFID
jgi:hypothetical protein